MCVVGERESKGCGRVWDDRSQWGGMVKVQG